MIGVVPADGDTPMCCVMQYMAKGDLKKHLMTHQVKYVTYRTSYSTLTVFTQVYANPSVYSPVFRFGPGLIMLP